MLMYIFVLPYKSAKIKLDILFYYNLRRDGRGGEGRLKSPTYSIIEYNLQLPFNPLMLQFVNYFI